MKSKNRFISLLLALIISSGALVSCSGNSSDGTESDTAENTEQTAVTDAEDAAAAEEVEEDDEATHYYENMEAVDYDGWTLRIANDGVNPEYFSSYLVEELTGDAFNDALYDRQINIADKYNIEFSETHDGAADAIKKNVTAGSHDVSFGYVLCNDCMGLIGSKYVMAISDMPVINFERPYWDQGAQKALSIFGKIYHGYCDISFDHYEGMASIFCNGTLLDEVGETMRPYDYIREGNWTLDKMYELETKVARDVDGNGQLDTDTDIYGFVGRVFEYLPSLYSSGTSLVKYDEDTQTYVLNLEDETVMAVGDMLHKIIDDPALATTGTYDTLTKTIFKENRALFYSRLIGDYTNLRDKEDDYSISCYPSLTETDEINVYIQNPSAILVPSDCDDTERLGTIIEALAAYTYENVMDAYINKTVIGKGARDKDSADILRIMIQHRTYDLSYVFGSSVPRDLYQKAIQDSTYASMQKKGEKQFSKAVSKAVAALKGEN